MFQFYSNSDAEFCQPQAAVSIFFGSHQRGIANSSGSHRK